MGSQEIFSEDGISELVLRGNESGDCVNETWSGLSPETRFQMVVVFTVLTGIGFLLNGCLLGYIIANHLYRNYVSSHFIAHLALTNMIGCGYLLPVFIYSLGSGPGCNVFQQHEALCRFQAFVHCATVAVIYYMTTCVAGVHLLTFARIHYDQLFGLPPHVICGLSWLIGAAMGLPCLTNYDIVDYDVSFHLCTWKLGMNGYKFLSYVALLGVLLPLMLTFYAYFRVLGIFYHSPVVFQALGLYKSRFLVYGLLLCPLSQIPFYVLRFIPDEAPPIYAIASFFAYFMCIADPALYGASLFLMKEEDMALTARSHKATTYHAPGTMPPQEL